MRLLHKINWLCLTAAILVSAETKGQDTLRLQRQECEAIFLQENLLLLAEKLEIDKSEAMVLQAGLWPNPNIVVDEVNLWATPKQLAVFGDELRGFNGGTFGKNLQIAIGVEQMILTAGKRRKLMDLEQVSVEKSKTHFEELLRSLKAEFRNNITRLIYLQKSAGIYNKQIQSLRLLSGVFEKQVRQGNVAQDEFVRLKALELEFSKKLHDIYQDVTNTQKELKQLMHLPPDVFIIIQEEDYVNIDKYKQLPLLSLLDTAKNQRPDLKISRLEEDYFRYLYKYEKAQKVPNITLKGSYDRGSSFMYNFVGFGIGIDLPVFNRNQGNIRYAEAGIQQSKMLSEYKEMSVGQEISSAYQNLMNAINFYESIDQDYEKSLDDLLSAYNKNFTDRNMSLLQYVDFVEAYLENKNIILEAGRDVMEKIEELHYIVGKDL